MALALLVDVSDPHDWALPSGVEHRVVTDDASNGDDGELQADLIVIGPAAINPLLSAQRLSKRYATPELVIVAPRQQMSALRERLRITPFIPLGTRLVVEDDVDAVRREVTDALDRASRRREHERALGRARSALTTSEQRGDPEPEPLHREYETRQRLYAALVESSDDAILCITPDGVITAWNPAAHRQLGYGPTEAIGQSLDILAGNDGQAFLSQVLRRICEGHTMRMETTLRRKDGQQIDVSLTASPIRTRGEPVVGASVIARDITEAKRAQDDLVRYSKELERSNRDLADFVHVASHDLRAPLRDVDNLAQWIHEDAIDHLPDGSVRHLLILHSRIRRMEALLEDLLEYSRVGKVNAEAEPVDVSELLREVVEMLPRPQDFTVELPPGPIVVRTPRAPLRVVLLNLVSNAIKHHDRPDGRVTISATRDEGLLRICVADDGPGIPEHLHDRAFAMFQTLRPRDEVEGSGMGLPIVKKTVETIGGSITLRSSVGAGAMFTFTWPHTPQPVGD